MAEYRSTVGLYVVAFFFAGLAGWRVVAGIGDYVQLGTLVALMLGASVTAFLVVASNLRIKRGEWEIMIVRQSEATIGVGGVARNQQESVIATSVSPRVSAVARTDSGIVPWSSKPAIFGVDVDEDPDDPRRGKFGGSRIGDQLEISATVKPHPEDPSRAVVKLRVEDGKRCDMVKFFLHPTFKNNVVKVPEYYGTAELVVVAWGTFTVGATTDDGRSVEIDLSTCPGGPAEFYAR